MWQYMVPEGECESAQFRTSAPLSVGDTIGTCSLSSLERSIRPQAYRSSVYRDEYLQDQCHNVCECLNQYVAYISTVWHNVSTTLCHKISHVSAQRRRAIAPTRNFGT